MLATDALIGREKTGIGDKIFVIGLFSEHYRQEHNLPVVRFGNISLMPAEQLSVRVAEDSIIQVYGYLVEAMSWQGHSGSPVFIYYPFDREPGKSKVAVYPLSQPDPLSGTEQFKLLGLVCAHYSIEQEVKMSDTIPEEQKDPDHEQASLAFIYASWLLRLVAEILNTNSKYGYPPTIEHHERWLPLSANCAVYNVEMALWMIGYKEF